MKIIKGLLWAALALSICVGFALFYLLQPAGKVEQFAAWQYQSNHPTTSNNTTSETTNIGLKVHYFGVSTLLFDDGDSQILIDGFFSRPSLSQVMFSRLQSQPDLLNSLIQQHQLQRTRAILVTHSHYDHSLDLPFLAQQLQHSQIIGSNSSLNIARAAKIAETRLSHVNPAQPLQIGKFKITAIPSQHTPATAINNDLGEQITHPLHLPARFYEFKEGGSFDYYIQHPEQNILVKASTGAIPKQLKHLQVDTLFLGIAQLSKQSTSFQQQYLDETLGTLRPSVVIPIHWDNFFLPLSQTLQFLPRIADHGPRSMQSLIEYAESQNTQVILLDTTTPYPLRQKLHPAS